MYHRLEDNDNGIRWRALAFTVGFAFFCFFVLFVPWAWGAFSLARKIFGF